jgi:hypothetical protein
MENAVGMMCKNDTEIKTPAAKQWCPHFHSEVQILKLQSLSSCHGSPAFRALLLKTGRS